MTSSSFLNATLPRIILAAFIASGLTNAYLLLSIGPSHGRNAYTDAFLPFSVLPALLFLIVLIQHIKYNKSSAETKNGSSAAENEQQWVKMFHVEHFEVALLLLFLLMLLSLSYTPDPLLAVTRLSWLGSGLLAFFIIFHGSRLFHVEHSERSQKIVPRGTLSDLQRGIMDCSTWNIPTIARGVFLSVAVANSLLSLYQVIFQRSLGLYLLGESRFFLGEPGIAKIFLFGEYYQRAYGLFPHPNINAFFLLLSLFILYRSSVPRGTSAYEFFKQCSTWNIVIFLTSLFFLTIALIAAFSKGAFIILGIFIALWCFRIVPRGTKQQRIPANGSTWNARIISGAAILLLITIVLLGLYTFVHRIESLLEREILFQESAQTARLSLLGDGLGSTSSTWNIRYVAESAWLAEPVHNVFLLVLADLGLVGLFLWTLFYLELAHVPRGTFHPEDWIVWIGLGVFMSVDHYIWDSSQAWFIFCVFLAVWQGRIRKLTNSR